MHKLLVALAISGATSVPATAQTAPAPAPATEQAQPAKPQMIKKRVCEQVDEDPYSRLGARKICKTIEVPATESGAANGQKAPSSSERGN